MTKLHTLKKHAEEHIWT